MSEESDIKKLVSDMREMIKTEEAPVQEQSSTVQESAPVQESASTRNALYFFNATKAVGDKIGVMKKAKAPKEEITKVVDELKSAKIEYKSALGHEYDANNPPAEDAKVSASSAKAVDSSKPEQVVTPWDVKGDEETGIDYDKLIDQFGCTKITPELIQKFEDVTGHKCHHLIRRGIIYSHRELDILLEKHAKGEKFYLYTGRGPSADTMHMGHLVPFMLTKWLQDVFDCPLVIQMTDDEKFLFKPNLELEECYEMALQNCKDIIAVGFNADKTFIFSDIDYISSSRAMYMNMKRIEKSITYNQAKGAFGFGESDNIGKVSYPAIQAAPSFSSTFPQIFNNRVDIPCLIPCAIDQDPFFRITRDVAPRLGYHKPALIHSKFFPALQGQGTKMSSSNPNSNITLTDTHKQIKNKINKHAFSGGKATVEEHKKLGGNCDTDISYQYLTFFLEDDEELATVKKSYSSGEMLSGEIKAKLISTIWPVVESFQARRAAVTDDHVKEFMRTRKLKFDYDAPKPKVVDDGKKKKEKKRGGMTKEDKAKRAAANMAARDEKNGN